MPFQIRQVLVLAIGALLGFGLAQGLSGLLKIEILPKELPPEARLSARQPPEGPPPLEPVAAILLSPGTLSDDLLAQAAEELDAAFEERTGIRPRIAEATPDAAAYAPDDPQGFALVPKVKDDRRLFLISSRSRLGTAYGLYYLADEVRTGAGEEIFAAPVTKQPAFPHRWVDLGGVGVPKDPAHWDPTNYRHNLGAFHDAFLEGPPYVDPQRMATYEEDFRSYLHRMIAYGNNGLVVSGFLEFVDFDLLGDGLEIYPAESPYRAQHRAMREHLGRLLEYAHSLGLEVILYTDMVALTPSLREYFQRRFGGLATEDPAFWEVYRLGLEELFQKMPYVDGLMVRIGEAGAVYNVPGWDYTSELAVRTVPAVQAMLRALLQAAEAHGKLIVFRNWAVGLGQVGDMHEDPEAYKEILEGIDSPNLIVSTKYAMGDYYSYLPLNPTLTQGTQKRIVELQNRREYEGFCAFPNYVAPVHQLALKEFREANPQIVGAWQWNQNGGPQQAGPMSLYPLYGFCQWIDANAYVTSRLLWEPSADPVELTEAWVRRNFGNNPTTAHNMTEILLRSREAVLQGLYIGPFARVRVRAQGRETNPMMWIFQWDIPDGSVSVLSMVYQVCKGRIEEAIAEGFRAVEVARKLRALAEEVDPTNWHKPELYPKVLASLDYEESLFETLAWYRRAFLRYYQWLDTGDAAAFSDWRDSYARFQELAEDHLARFGEDLDFPAYNFFSADAGMAIAERGPTMAWLARVLLFLSGLLLLLGCGPLYRHLPDFPGKRGLRALWLGWTTAPDCMPAFGRVDWLLVVLRPALVLALGYLTLSSFLSPRFLVLMVIVVGVFSGLLLLLTRSGERGRLAGALFGSLVLLNVLPLAAAAVRGPFYLWLRFLTNPTFRAAFTAAGGAVGLWALRAVYRTQVKAGGAPSLSPLGKILIAGGGTLLALGAVTAGVGLERAITALNNELLILPPALSLILGITTHLQIPTALPYWTIGVAAGIIAFGLLLSIPRAIRAPRFLARKGS